MMDDPEIAAGGPAILLHEDGKVTYIGFATYERAIAGLKAAEWHGTGDYGDEGACPICLGTETGRYGRETKGHRPTCILADALRQSGMSPTMAQEGPQQPAGAPQPPSNEKSSE